MSLLVTVSAQGCSVGNNLCAILHVVDVSVLEFLYWAWGLTYLENDWIIFKLYSDWRSKTFFSSRQYNKHNWS